MLLVIGDAALTCWYVRGDRKDGLRKIANEIGEKCNEEELDEIIEYCSDGDLADKLKERSIVLSDDEARTYI